MTAEEVNTVLGSNREMIISFFDENVKADNFYTLKWFMIRVLNEATLSWARRKTNSFLPESKRYLYETNRRL